ncbi:hypothetical protein VTL71DRAFT_1716 [Oculimacula yallundae]|uniref:Uncharacterized protein n=1 Tax=Oculimacula yallundae TaxID=86028 RepID=A0ABR4CCN3_9HELO
MEVAATVKAAANMMVQLRRFRSHLEPLTRSKKKKKEEGTTIDLGDVPDLGNLDIFEAKLRANGHAVSLSTQAKVLHQDPGNDIPSQQNDVLHRRLAPQKATLVADSPSVKPAVAAWPAEITSPPNPMFAALLEDRPAQYGKFYISRLVAPPDCEKTRTFYDKDPEVGIQLRLMPLIRFRSDDARSGNYVDYVMGGMSANEADCASKPMIAIFCADKRQKETIERRLRSMPAILQGYDYVVLNEETKLASGEVPLPFPNVQNDDRDVYGDFTAETATACGMACSVRDDLGTFDSHLTFKLGGTIVVGHISYGLTTAHKLSKQDSSLDAPVTNSSREFVGMQEPDSSNTIGQLEIFEYSTTEPGTEELSWDWALVRLEEKCIRPNLIVSPYIKPDSTGEPEYYPIEGIVNVAALSFGEVWVIESPSSSILAVLIERTVLFAFGTNNFEGYPIKLAKPLEDGSSGSWVIRDGKVCGYIFSRAVGKQWAYMLPIEPVTDRISRIFSAKSSKPVSVTIPYDPQEAMRCSLAGQLAEEASEASVLFPTFPVSIQADLLEVEPSSVADEAMLAATAKAFGEVTAPPYEKFHESIHETGIEGKAGTRLSLELGLTDLSVANAPDVSTKVEKGKGHRQGRSRWDMSKTDTPEQYQFYEPEVRDRVLAAVASDQTINEKAQSGATHETVQKADFDHLPPHGEDPIMLENLEHSQAGSKKAEQAIQHGSRAARITVEYQNLHDLPTDQSKSKVRHDTKRELKSHESTQMLLPRERSLEIISAQLHTIFQTKDIFEELLSLSYDIMDPWPPALPVDGSINWCVRSIRSVNKQYLTQNQWLQQLAGAVLTEKVIFEDFQLKIYNSYASRPVKDLLRTGTDTPSCWFDIQFQQNLIVNMARGKLKAIYLTCIEIERLVRHLRDVVRARLRHTETFNSVNDMIFSHRQSIGDQVTELSKHNTRLARLIAYIPSQKVLSAANDESDLRMSGGRSEVDAESFGSSI